LDQSKEERRQRQLMQIRRVMGREQSLYVFSHV
jgi:hypothetical protein